MSPLLLLVANSVLAAGDTGVQLANVQLNEYDFDSKQRGAKLFVNYCIGCHSLQYVRYSRVAEDLGIPDDIMQEHIAFGADLFSPMNSAMDAEQAKDWFNQAIPPDLSVIARSRSADWLYTFLKSFYRDPERPSGWNNTIFSNVAMPNVLHSLQGIQQVNEDGELIMVKDGSLDHASYDTAVADLVNFLVYVGEPSKLSRHRLGYAVMLFLLIMLILTYMLYRDYWRDIN